MSDLFLQLVLMSSLAVIVYLMAIAVPRVKDDEYISENGRKLVGSLPLERMDVFLNNLKDRSLRRLRIYLLKAEHFVSNRIQKSRELGKKTKWPKERKE